MHLRTVEPFAVAHRERDSLRTPVHPAQPIKLKGSILFLLALFLLPLVCSGNAAHVAHSDSAVQRPRVALVLGGGGARGAAHIGVLRVLEELRIPIDCIAGTSMGSLVGAAYASGMTSRDIEKLVAAIDWSETFGSAGTRALQPVSTKAAYTTYSNKLEFGLKKNGLLAPGGLIASQQIETILRSIVGRARYQDSFDDLPIPFRAIATDIGSGDMLILSGGDLAAAMRASMAVPGAFSPVRTDERVLVDGGLVRNLPVDVGRALCGDVIIAASLVNPTPTADNLRSALGVVSQMVDLMIKNNEREQLAALTPADVPILISLPNMSSGDFDKVPVAIPLGVAAARELTAQLSRLSVSSAEYARWRARISAAAAVPPQRPTITGIEVEGLKRASPRVVATAIESRAGEPVNEARLAKDAQRIFARGDFEGVDYHVTEENGRADVTFLPREKSWGPNYVRFDIGLMSSFGSDTGYILRADHLRTWLNPLGGRWHNAVQIGRTALAQAAFFQPLTIDQSLFVEPRVQLSRELQDLYDDGKRVARYKLTALDLRLDGGVALGTWGEWRLGLRHVRSDFEADTGTRLLPEFDGVKASGWTSGFVLDTRDSSFIPTRGTYVDLDFFSAAERFGSDATYQRAKVFAQQVLPLRDDLLYLQLSAGSDFDSALPAYDLFTAGGSVQPAGFASEELRGREYAFGRVAYLRKVTDLQTLLGQALYAGVSLEAGNMYDRIDDTDASGAILGSSVFFGGRTPLGPLLISFGYAEGGHKAAYVQLGRPLKEP